MKNILIICHHFVPYTESVGGVVRAITMADYLKKNGYNVFILTSDGYNFGYLGYHKVVKKFNTFYLNDPLKSYLQSKQQRLMISNNYKINFLKVLYVPLRFILKKFIKFFLVPDIGITVYFKYCHKSFELINEHKISSVIITSPPFSMNLLGKKIKNKFKDSVKVILDYRDSWNFSTINGHPNIISNYISRHFEKNSLIICDYITYVSKPIIKKINNGFNINIYNKSKLIMNGYYRDLSPLKRKKINTGPVKIGYFGMVDDISGSYRNIKPIISEISDLNKSSIKFTLDIYGPNTFVNTNIDDISWLEIHGNIVNSEVNKLMCEMDFLLIIHTDKSNSDEVITGKFFEYIAARRPIICIGPYDMEASRLVKKYDLGLTAKIDDKKNMRKILNKLLHYNYKDFAKNFDFGCFHRDRQYKQLEKLINLENDKN